MRKLMDSDTCLALGDSDIPWTLIVDCDKFDNKIIVHMVHEDKKPDGSVNNTLLEVATWQHGEWSTTWNKTSIADIGSAMRTDNLMVPHSSWPAENHQWARDFNRGWIEFLDSIEATFGPLSEVLLQQGRRSGIICYRPSVRNVQDT